MRVKSFNKNKIEMEAYHGTLRKYAKSIETDGFGISKGKDHWLGEGVYFFREDQEQAKFYAIRANRNKLKELNQQGKFSEAKKPEYRGCVIQWCDHLLKEEFLNLDTRAGAIFFERHMRETKEILEKSGHSIEVSLWEFNDVLFEGILPQYKVIQRTFPVPSKNYGDHNIALFNTPMFFPILKGNKTIDEEVETIKTELIHGTQVVVREPERILLDKLIWVAC